MNWLERKIWKRGRKKHWLNFLKRKSGCQECGYKDVRALQWAHKEPVLRPKGSSKGIIGTMIGRGAKKLMEEVRKCRVLCANCHLIETKEEGLLTRGKENGK